MLVLEDQALIDDVVEQIRETGDNVEQCLHRVSVRYLKFFDQLSDQYLRERASDLRDVMRRLLHNLLSVQDVPEMKLTIYRYNMQNKDRNHFVQLIQHFPGV